MSGAKKRGVWATLKKSMLLKHLLVLVSTRFRLVRTGLGVAQGLVVAGTLRQFAGVLYLHFNVECTDGFALGSIT